MDMVRGASYSEVGLSRVVVVENKNYTSRTVNKQKTRGQKLGLRLKFLSALQLADAIEIRPRDTSIKARFSAKNNPSHRLNYLGDNGSWMNETTVE